MVNLEQIRLLESRVQKAIQFIQKLREENRSLRASLEKYERRIGDLEGMVGDFRNGQDEIEVSITNALKQLDRLEDELLEEPEEATAKPPAKPGPEQPVAPPGPAGSVRTEHTKSQPAKATPPRRQSDNDFEAESVEADANPKKDSKLLAGDSPSEDEDVESELDIF